MFQKHRVMYFCCDRWLKSYVHHLFVCHQRREVDDMIDCWSSHVRHLLDETCHLYIVVVMVINIIHDRKLLPEANVIDKVLTALSLIDKCYNDDSASFLSRFVKPVFTMVPDSQTSFTFTLQECQYRINRVDSFTISLLNHISLCNPSELNKEEFYRAQCLIQTMPKVQAHEPVRRNNDLRRRRNEKPSFEVRKLLCYEDL